MTTADSLIFAGMVFVAIVLLAAAMIVPTAGTAAQASKKMRSRIYRHLESQGDGLVSLVRDNYLNQLTPFERSIESISLLRPLSNAVEQSGLGFSVAKLIIRCMLWGGVAFIGVFLLSRSLAVAALAGLVLFLVPIFNVYRKRAARLSKFEEQLPEALDVMARATQGRSSIYRDA